MDKEIKLLLAGLSLFLQAPLSDEQILLYAREFQDIGPLGLAEAITRLKADPGLYPGKFPLPAKIKSYLVEALEDEASRSARRIMSCANAREAYEKLTQVEIRIAKEYGLTSIIDRSAHATPTIYAQLRDALKEAYGFERRLALAGPTASGLPLTHEDNGNRPRLGRRDSNPGGERLADLLRQNAYQEDRGEEREEEAHDRHRPSGGDDRQA